LRSWTFVKSCVIAGVVQKRHAV